jgi:hypothetical protein
MILSTLLASMMALSTSPATSGVLNLRGADIGDSCEKAASTEPLFGTQPASSVNEMADNGALLFTDDTVAGQTTQVLYTCRNGTPGSIFKYAITVSTTDEARARSLYVAAKAAIIERLGSPGLDSEQLSPADKKIFADVLNGPEALSTWDTSSAYLVHVSMQKSPSSNQWTVVTSVSPQSSAKVATSE